MFYTVTGRGQFFIPHHMIHSKQANASLSFSEHFVYRAVPIAHVGRDFLDHAGRALQVRVGGQLEVGRRGVRVKGS